MATTSPLRGTVTAVTFAAGDSTLAAGAYAVSSAIDTSTLGTNGSTAQAADDLDLTVSAGIAATAVANDTIDLYALTSLDGTTYSDGPADASTDRTHNANMAYLGSLTVPSAAAQTIVGVMSALAVCFRAGTIPRYLKIVVFNGSGAALTSLAASVQGINESVA